MIRKVGIAISWTIASALVLTGCTAAPSPTPTASPTPTPEPVYVTTPLTGEKFLDGTPEAIGATRSSVACKIDNSQAARPQLGLNSTDIVYDEMVEGGLTRLVAVWQSKLPEAVGPVRSIRPMDPDIISPLGGIVCYSGGQLIFVNMMRNTQVFNASETTEQGKGTFKRATDRYAPHNVIVNALKLSTAHPEILAPQKHFEFASDLAGATAFTEGKLVDKFTVKFPAATALWVPNGNETKWLRTQDGAIHKDAADGNQIAATNVVVLQVGIDRSYADKKYGHIPKTIMVGSGKAWVFTGASYVAAKWSKANQNSPVVLITEAGTPVLLAPGNTWVELMPKAPEGSLTLKVRALAATPTPSQ